MVLRCVGLCCGALRFRGFVVCSINLYRDGTGRCRVVICCAVSRCAVWDGVCFVTQHVVFVLHSNM